MTKIQQLLNLLEDGEGPGINAMGVTPNKSVIKKKRRKKKFISEESTDLDRIDQMFTDMTSMQNGTFEVVYNEDKQIEIRYGNINGPKLANATVTDGEPRINVDLTELLTFLITKHDLTYMYSDGYSYRKGQDSLNTIKRLASKLEPETVKEIWNNEVDRKIKQGSREEHYFGGENGLQI